MHWAEERNFSTFMISGQKSQILKETNEIYIKRGVKEKSTKATMAVNFIEDRLESVETLLLKEKEELNIFFKIRLKN